MNPQEPTRERIVWRSFRRWRSILCAISISAVALAASAFTQPYQEGLIGQDTNWSQRLSVGDSSGIVLNIACDQAGSGCVAKLTGLSNSISRPVVHELPVVMGTAPTPGISHDPVAGKFYFIGKSAGAKASTLIEIDPLGGGARTLATLPAGTVRTLPVAIEDAATKVPLLLVAGISSDQRSGWLASINPANEETRVLDIGGMVPYDITPRGKQGSRDFALLVKDPSRNFAQVQAASLANGVVTRDTYGPYLPTDAQRLYSAHEQPGLPPSTTGFAAVGTRWVAQWTSGVAPKITDLTCPGLADTSRMALGPWVNNFTLFIPCGTKGVARYQFSGVDYLLSKDDIGRVAYDGRTGLLYGMSSNSNRLTVWDAFTRAIVTPPSPTIEGATSWMAGGSTAFNQFAFVPGGTVTGRISPFVDGRTYVESKAALNYSGCAASEYIPTASMLAMLCSSAIGTSGKSSGSSTIDGSVTAQILSIYAIGNPSISLLTTTTVPAQLSNANKVVAHPGWAAPYYYLANPTTGDVGVFSDSWTVIPAQMKNALFAVNLGSREVYAVSGNRLAIFRGNALVETITIPGISDDSALAITVKASNQRIYISYPSMKLAMIDRYPTPAIKVVDTDVHLKYLAASELRDELFSASINFINVFDGTSLALKWSSQHLLGDNPRGIALDHGADLAYVLQGKRVSKLKRLDDPKYPFFLVPISVGLEDPRQIAIDSLNRRFYVTGESAMSVVTEGDNASTNFATLTVPIASATDIHVDVRTGAVMLPSTDGRSIVTKSYSPRVGKNAPPRDLTPGAIVTIPKPDLMFSLGNADYSQGLVSMFSQLGNVGGPWTVLSRVPNQPAFWTFSATPTAPLNPGLHIMYVWGRDDAGNLYPTAVKPLLYQAYP